MAICSHTVRYHMILAIYGEIVAILLPYVCIYGYNAAISGPTWRHIMIFFQRLRGKTYVAHKQDGFVNNKNKATLARTFRLQRDSKDHQKTIICPFPVSIKDTKVVLRNRIASRMD